MVDHESATGRRTLSRAGRTNSKSKFTASTFASRCFTGCGATLSIEGSEHACEPILELRAKGVGSKHLAFCFTKIDQ